MVKSTGIEFVFVIISVLVSVLAIPTAPVVTNCKPVAKKTTILSRVTVNKLSLSTYDTSVGTKVRVSCLDKDYVLNGASELKCLSSGEWSSSIPSCSVKQIAPKNHKLIIGLSVGAGCPLIILFILILIVLVKTRRNNKASTRNIDNRLKKKKQRKSYSEEMKTKYTEQETRLDVPPNVYKVWSHDRTIKKFITAFDISDLKKKGSKVFDVHDAYIVLEEDGTEIEDNTALEACKERTLQILSKNQSWYRQFDNLTIDLRGNGDDRSGTVKSYHL